MEKDYGNDSYEFSQLHIVQLLVNFSLNILTNEGDVDNFPGFCQNRKFSNLKFCLMLFDVVYHNFQIFGSEH